MKKALISLMFMASTALHAQDLHKEALHTERHCRNTNFLDGDICDINIGEGNALPNFSDEWNATSNIVVGDKNNLEGMFGDVYAEKNIVIGNDNEVSGFFHNVMGQGNLVTNYNNIVIGDNNNASGYDNVVMGVNSMVFGNGSVVLGNSMRVTEDYVFSVGTDRRNRRIIDVADGIKDTDAVNVRQLKQAYNVLGVKIAHFDHKLTKTTKELRAGIAGASAMAGLASSQIAGKGMLAVSMGGYNGQNALAVGYSRNSEDNRYAVKVSASLNTVKDINYSASVGMYF